MALVTMPHVKRVVTVGVDSHKDTHAAAVVDEVGRTLASREIPTTRRGYEQLVGWAEGFGAVARFGVEGTGAYAAGLARFLGEHSYAVVEVDRPNRQLRRRRGKSDPIDAEAAARAALSGEATGQPKAGDGYVEMIRALRLARRSAIKASTQAANQLDSLVLTAPEELRARLRGLKPAELVAVAARFRPGAITTPVAATKLAMAELAHRHQALAAEIARLDAELDRLVAKAAGKLLARKGVGTDVAGALLVAAGDNPDRLRSEASFASLCGSSPLDASSGRQQRHRLNRGGDRQANGALWRIVIVRMSCDQPTIDYVKRRTTEGKTKREIIRCLKRYVAREVYHCLRDLEVLPPPATSSDTP
jgi:transposase